MGTFIHICRLQTQFFLMLNGFQIYLIIEKAAIVKKLANAAQKEFDEAKWHFQNYWTWNGETGFFSEYDHGT